MTEQQWLVCAEPRRVLTFLREKASRRKLRLFAVACCQRVSHLLDETQRGALGLTEGYADTQRRGELQAALRAQREAADRIRYEGMMPRRAAAERILKEGDRASSWAADCLWWARSWAAGAAWMAARANPATAAGAHASAAVAAGWCRKAREKKRGILPDPALSAEETAPEARAQADLLRDLFGNPFRRPRVQRAWLKWDGGTVVRVAKGAYDERAFDRLPVLADALEEAGCTDDAILGHCRAGGAHVRGCWVVDLLLGQVVAPGGR
jgi:hypothetical protein